MEHSWVGMYMYLLTSNPGHLGIVAIVEKYWQRSICCWWKRV